MIIEIYLYSGKIERTKVEIEKHEDEEEVMQNAAANLLRQISETGFACIPNDGGYCMINGRSIDEIRIAPEEKDNANVTSE